MNRECILLATKAALAFQSSIAPLSSFDRKHYFYPDLPNGYQITQYFNPFAKGGYLELGPVEGLDLTKKVHIHQIQIEQDSAKTIVDTIENNSWIDLNRAGAGVLEIVTQPDLGSGKEAIAFLKKAQRLLWYNGVTSSQMDEGAFRADVNISVRRKGEPLGTRIELKHLVKFSSISTAIDYEIKRQIAILESGGKIEQETRGFNPKTGETVILRAKEELEDYNYFPDADIPRLHISNRYIDQIKAQSPESLDNRRDRLINYGLLIDQIDQLLGEPGAVEYLEDVLKRLPEQDARTVALWILGDLTGWLHKRDLKLSSCPVSPDRFADLIGMVFSEKISGMYSNVALTAKRVLDKIMDGDQRSPLSIVTAEGWFQEADWQGLDDLCDQVIGKHPDIVVSIDFRLPRSKKERLDPWDS